MTLRPRYTPDVFCIRTKRTRRQCKLPEISLYFPASSVRI